MRTTLNPDDEALFRRYEQQLDEHHRALDLWAQPRAESIYAILTVTDAIYLVPALVGAPGALTVGLGQFLQGAEDGVNQALRWLCADGQTPVRSRADHNLIASAHDFARFAADYADIADFHMMHGRGLANVTIEEKTKTVTFDPVPGPGLDDISAFHEQVRYQDRLGKRPKPVIHPAQIQQRHDALDRIEHEVVDGRIVLDAFAIDLVSLLGDTNLPTRHFELCPLPLDADLVGFDVAEYWSFIEAVTAWSHAAFERYCRCVSSGIAQHLCMPTQLVTDQEFIKRVTTLSALDANKAMRILDRLTFRPTHKADLRATPFLRSNNEVAWSPAIVLKFRHERNMLKVMARGSKPMREHAATLNGSRDRLLSRGIGTEFNKRGYQFKLGTAICANGESTDIDILLWLAKKPSEILIIEAKALVAPDEINEVSDATSKIIQAQKQAASAIRILGAMALDAKRRAFPFVAWERVCHYVGAVATIDTEPHARVDPAPIPVVSLASLTWRFRSRDFRSPQRFAEACRDREWLKEEIQQRPCGHKAVRVGALTYRLPVVALGETRTDNTSR